MTTATAHTRLGGAPGGPARLAPVALFVGTALVAMLMSPTVSLWTDESITLSAASRTPAELWALLQHVDAVHGLYYAFMSGWIQVFGDSPFSVRLPSALAAAGTALGVLRLTTLLASTATAWVAAVACATLPRLTWGGIEARPFVFAALAAAWATYLLVRAVRSSSRAIWAAYGTVAAVGIAVNIYLVLVVAGHAVTLLLLTRDRRRILGFVIAAVAAITVAAPVILLSRAQQGQLGDAGDRNPLSIARKVVINQLFLGETPSPDAAPAWFTRSWQIAAVVAAACGLLAIALAIVRRPAAGDDRRTILAVGLPWIALPTAAIAAYAVLLSPIYQPRYLTLVAPAGALLIAAGVRTVRSRGWRIAGITVYAVAVTIVFTSQRIPFAKSGSDWSAVAATVARSAELGDAVYFAPRDTDGPTGTAMLTSRRIAYAYPGSFQDLNDLTLERTGAETATLDGFSRGLDSVLPLPDEVDRIWGIYSKKGPKPVRTESDDLLRGAGYTGSVVWDGPSTVVVLYGRAD